MVDIWVNKTFVFCGLTVKVKKSHKICTEKALKWYKTDISTFLSSLLILNTYLLILFKEKNKLIIKEFLDFN